MFLYYVVAKDLPEFMKGNEIRRFLCRKLFKSLCGNKFTVKKGAIFGDGSKIIIGNNAEIGVNSRLMIKDDLIIGDNVVMGPDVMIIDSNHNFTRRDIPIKNQGNEKPKKIIIEEDCWIGARVIILPGVTIGRGAVVGASSVVTKDIDPYAVVAGNPARNIRYR